MRLTATDLYRDAAPRGAFTQIPIIDLSALRGTDAQALQALIEEIRHACSQVGFFYIKNHGISRELIDRAYARSREFFALPAQEKQKYHISTSAAHRGFIPLYEESFYDSIDSASCMSSSSCMKATSGSTIQNSAR